MLNSLLENCTDSIDFKDKDSKFIFISRSLANAFSLKNPDEAIGKTDFDFFSKEHAQQAYEDEQKIISSGVPITLEEKETWTDKDDTWVLTEKMPIRDNKGNIIGTFGISKDITERKRIEQQNHEEHEFLRTLIDTIPDQIYAKDKKGKKTLSNISDWQASGGHLWKM